MTKTQFDALAVGDTLIRVSNGKSYVVCMTNRGITPGCNAAWAQIVKNGKGFGRGYNVTLDEFTVVGQPAATRTCGHCGGQQPLNESCICFDNDCQ